MEAISMYCKSNSQWGTYSGLKVISLIERIYIMYVGKVLIKVCLQSNKK